MDSFLEYVNETCDRIEAEVTFEDQLTVVCPVCGAATGVLCNSDLLWVHLERFKLVWSKESDGHQNR